MVSHCKACGFEAAASLIINGKCHACRLPVGKDLENQSGRKRAERLIEIIKCACGCGTSFNRYDSRGRPRLYCDRRHQYKDRTREAIRKARIAQGIGKVS